MSPGEIRPYSAEDPCAKCGFDVIDDRYMTHTDVYGWIGYFLEDLPWEIVGRECKRCRYKWFTTPLDHAETE